MINRLLVLTFYFEPDLSAGSFRATAMVAELQKRLGESRIDVLSTAPNRYKSIVSRAAEREDRGNVTIYRFPLPAHKSGMKDQARAFGTYARQVMRFIKDKQYDGIWATSSRLMTASLAAYVASKTRAPLYLDIRDIFVDTMGDILPKPLSITIKPLLSWLEGKTIKKAAKINLVSEGFAEYFEEKYPSKAFSYFSNGIDAEFLSGAYRDSREVGSAHSNGRPITILYAGNIGEGQGLHSILPALAKRLGDSARFRVLGDGGRKDVLMSHLKRECVSNVELLPPVKRSELLMEYTEADVLFIHLNDHPAFRKVLPSKVFEYAATGKPILAGVSGYSAKFLRSEVVNAAIFAPCCAQQAEQALNTLSLGLVDRASFIQRYLRSNIIEAMTQDVLRTLETAE